MNKIVSLLFFVSAVAYAQPDLGSGISLPSAGIRAVTPAPETPAPSRPSLFDTPPSKGFHIDEEPLNANFGKTKDFVNPNDAVVERLNKKPTESSADGAIRRDQFMGEIKTRTHAVRIVYRDHEAPDGDVCQVLINDAVVRPRIYLDSAPQSFDIVLLDGLNRIDFLALNQGESGPNTAEFEVYDEEGHLLGGGKWNLGTGFKATIVVTRQ
jgi:hypothetical protein